MDKQADYCWEYWDCPENIKDDCQVFKSEMGDQCWFIMSLKKGCPASEKYGSCFKCPFYKQHNS